MAVQDGYGKVSGSESLVFAYDLKDTINSYRGEPTTNICNNADFSTSITGTAGGTFGGWSFGSWDSSNSHETVTDTYNGETINALKITLGSYPAHFFSSNWGTETIPGRTYTWTNLMKGTPGQVVYMFSHWGNLLTVTLTGEWQEYSTTFVRGGSLGQYMYYNPSHTAVGNVIYVARVQVEEKTHKTPFTITSRSNTQGLLDLMGNSSINLSNVSFDSNAQMVFDGTGDYADLSNQLSGLDTSTLSIEMVFKSTSTDTSFRPLMGINSDQTNVGYICLGNFTGHWSNESLSCIFVNSSGTIFLSFAYTAGSTTLKDNQYHHIVFNFQTNNYKIFVDGQEVAVNASFRNGSQSTTMISNLFNTIASPNITIGHAGSSSNGFLGEIPVVKIYNRTLTSTEVSNNYLKYKRQYGLT